MYRWNTDKIVAHLNTFTEFESITVDEPGGDVDTDNIRVKVRGVDDRIYICGFSVDNSITDPSNSDVEMIEITDQSGDGLQSNSYTVAEAYIKVRQLFVGLPHNAAVVSNMKDYF